MGFDKPPHQNFIHFRISMDEHIAEGDQLTMLRNAFSRLRLLFCQLADGLANDLEPPLDS